MTVISGYIFSFKFPEVEEKEEVGKVQDGSAPIELKNRKKQGLGREKLESGT